MESYTWIMVWKPQSGGLRSSIQIQYKCQHSFVWELVDLIHSVVWKSKGLRLAKKHPRKAVLVALLDAKVGFL